MISERLSAPNARMALMAVIGLACYASAATTYIDHRTLIAEWTYTVATVDSVAPVEDRKNIRHVYKLTYFDGDGTRSATWNGGGAARFEPGDTIDVIYNPDDKDDVRPLPSSPAAAIGFMVFGGTIALLLLTFDFLRNHGISMTAKIFRSRKSSKLRN